MKVFPSDNSFIHTTMLIHRYYFYKNKRKVHHNTLKILIFVFFGSSDVKPQRSWLLKGVSQIHFKFNFLKRESLPETFNFRNLLQVTSENFYGHNSRFLFLLQFLFKSGIYQPQAGTCLGSSLKYILFMTSLCVPTTKAINNQ